MKLEAKARLQSLVGILAGVVNTTDRPPSTYLDEAEMDHQLPDQSAAPGPSPMGISSLRAGERLLKTGPLRAMPDLQG